MVKPGEKGERGQKKDMTKFKVRPSVCCGPNAARRMMPLGADRKPAPPCGLSHFADTHFPRFGPSALTAT